VVTHPAPAARHRAAGRLWSALFFFLAAVLTLTTTAGNASAATVPTNENRVGVTAPKLITAVGVPDHISAGQHPVRAGPLQDLAQGHGVHTYYVLGTTADGATTGNAVLVHNAGGGCTITANKASGDAFRDTVANFLRTQLGRTVTTDAEDRAALTLDTPYGPRVLDMMVHDPEGNLLGYVETKSGGAGYGGLQLLKDDWLRSQGTTIDVVTGR
jgi:hypothetical protein